METESAELQVQEMTERTLSKSMQVSLDNPVYAFQTIVSRAKPEYIVTLHKLLGTFAECASELKH